MRQRFDRRAFLAALAASVATPALANAPLKSLRPVARGGASGAIATRSPPSAEALVEAAKLGGRVTYAVADVNSGNVLEDRGSGTGLPPASVAKAVTALYALDTLGADYRFRTRLMATGPVQNGVLAGDLVLVGGGDPTLDTDSLAGLAAKLKAAGVREVRGKFAVHGRALPYARQIDPQQPEHVSYNPSVGGLNLNYNRVHFEWKRSGKGWAVTMDARTKKYRPEVKVATMKIAQRKVPVYSYARVGDTDSWTVASGALGKGGARWLPVRRPDLYAGEVFQTMARAQGIVLKAPEVLKGPPRGTMLADHFSDRLENILEAMLKYSTNLTAEAVGMTATVKRKGAARSIMTSAKEMNRWAAEKIGLKSAQFVDHSGLGGASRLDAADLARALARAHRAGALPPILKDIPMRDAQRKIVKNHPVKVRAKTGTLNFVSGLAGYIVAADGTELAFAIFAADTARRSRIKREDMERPAGARGWNGRAKKLQQSLIDRWGRLYGS